MVESTVKHKNDKTKADSKAKDDFPAVRMLFLSTSNYGKSYLISEWVLS